MRLGEKIPAVFKASLKILPDCTAIAFSYRGSAFISGEFGRGGGWDFWRGAVGGFKVKGFRFRVSGFSPAAGQKKRPV